MNQAAFKAYQGKEIIPAGLISLAFVVLIVVDQIPGIDINSDVWVMLMLAVFGVLMVIRYKTLLLYLTAFLVPLSVQVPVLAGSKLSAPAELITILFAAFLGIKVFAGARINISLLRHPISVLIMLDLGWMFVCSCTSGMPAVSFKRLVIRILYYICFYFFYFELYRTGIRHIYKVFLAYVLGMIIPVIYTLTRHYYIGFEMVGSQLLSAPFYFDHTVYGACLVFFIPFLYQAIANASGITKRGLQFLLILFLVATWLSFSRAAWLSLIIAFMFYYSVRLSFNWRLIFAGIVLLGGIVFLTTKKWDEVFSEKQQISHTNDVAMHIKSVSNISTDASNRERINRWKCALRMFADKPLLGFGPGTYQFFYGQYQHRNDLTRISTFTGNKGHAHSEYLNYLSESGLPGLLIFMCISGFCVFYGYRLVVHSADKSVSGIALFLTAGLITFYVHGFFNGFLEFDKMAMPVFSSVAGIVFLDLKTKKLFSGNGA